MPESVLMITAIAGAENCAAGLAKQFQMSVDTVSSRKEGAAALRRRSYHLVVIDASLIDPGEDDNDALLKHAGMAIPLAASRYFASKSQNSSPPSTSS